MATQQADGKNKVLAMPVKSVFDDGQNAAPSGSCKVVSVDKKTNTITLAITCDADPRMSESGKSYLLANLNVVLDGHTFKGKPIRISGNVMAKVGKGNK